MSFYLGWPNGVPGRRAKRPPRCGQVSGQEGRQQEGQGRGRHCKHPLVLDGATFMRASSAVGACGVPSPFERKGCKHLRVHVQHIRILIPRCISFSVIHPFAPSRQSYAYPFVFFATPRAPVPSGRPHRASLGGVGRAWGDDGIHGGGRRKCG